MWLLSGFGDRKQYNMISANMRPHEEILYSVKRHRLCEVNAILMGQNYKHLTELHPSQVCHTYLWAVMTGSPGDRKALRGWQTWAQPLGWPLSHWVCWVVSELVQGYHS